MHMNIHYKSLTAVTRGFFFKSYLLLCIYYNNTKQFKIMNTEQHITRIVNFMTLKEKVVTILQDQWLNTCSVNVCKVKKSSKKVK